MFDNVDPFLAVVAVVITAIVIALVVAFFRSGPQSDAGIQDYRHERNHQKTKKGRSNGGDDEWSYLHRRLTELQSQLSNIQTTQSEILRYLGAPQRDERTRLASQSRLPGARGGHGVAVERLPDVLPPTPEPEVPNMVSEPPPVPKPYRFDVQELVDLYNESPSSIRNHYTVRDFTVANMQELGKDQEVKPVFRLVEEGQQGEYWLVTSEAAVGHAVPRPKPVLTLGQIRSGVMDQVFDCSDFRTGYRYRKVRVRKPARFRLTSADQLEMLEMGALQLGDEEREI
jgi:hypothetical protein